MACLYSYPSSYGAAVKCLLRCLLLTASALGGAVYADLPQTVTPTPTPTAPEPIVDPVQVITYATRIDTVSWSYNGSRFICLLSHDIDGFGSASFAKEAGLSTRFTLHSKSPRMKSGKAELKSQPPAWLNGDTPVHIAKVNVRHGITPIKLGRKISERMLSELNKGMDLHLVRQPWYGDKDVLQVIVPSIGFRKVYSDYLVCLGDLLPVNFSQVEKKSLYYHNGEEDLRKSAQRYLDKVATYIKEDPAVKAVYIDGHTDSKGVRSENLAKSKERTQRIVDYLIENGVNSDLIVARWHGERYQVSSNKTKSGRQKNRRVTVRLSKEPPRQLIRPPKKADEKPAMPAEKAPAPLPLKSADNEKS